MFKAHRLLYHSTLGSREIKKEKVSGLILCASAYSFCFASVCWIDLFHGLALQCFGRLSVSGFGEGEGVDFYLTRVFWIDLFGPASFGV